MNNSLYERIKGLASEHGISIRKLEMELGFGSKAISKWDDHAPLITNVKKVADYFGVSVDYLLGSREEDDEVTAIRKQLMNKPEMRTLLDASTKCTKEEIIALTEMITKWKESSNE